MPRLPVEPRGVRHQQLDSQADGYVGGGEFQATAVCAIAFSPQVPQLTLSTYRQYRLGDDAIARHRRLCRERASAMIAGVDPRHDRFATRASPATATALPRKRWRPRAQVGRVNWQQGSRNASAPSPPRGRPLPSGRTHARWLPRARDPVAVARHGLPLLIRERSAAFNGQRKCGVWDAAARRTHAFLVREA